MDEISVGLMDIRIITVFIIIAIITIFVVIAILYTKFYVSKPLTTLRTDSDFSRLQLTKMNLMIKAARIGLWDVEIVRDDSVNPENVFIWSDDFRNMLGYENEDDFPNSLASLKNIMHPDYLERTDKAFIDHVLDTTGRTPFDVEYRLMKKNGEYAYFRACGEAIRDDDGNAIHVAGALMDINEIKNEHERLMLMLDTMPLSIGIWDKNYTIVDCNKASIDLLGLTEKQDYFDKFYTHCLPERQPDGQRSVERAAALLQDTFINGYNVFEWTLRKPYDGTLIPTEATLVRVKYGEDDAVIAYTRDLREQKKMLAEIKQNENLLRAVNQAATILLVTDDTKSLEYPLVSCMELIGRSMEVDRVHIWRAEKIGGNYQLSRIHCWLSEKAKELPEVPAGIMTPFYKMPEWIKAFKRGEYIDGITSQMPKDEMEYFASFNIKSVILMPLFLDDNFWGLVSIDDCTNERVYTEDEVTILESVSYMMASAIDRHAITAKISDANTRVKLMLDSSPICAQIWDKNLNTVDCNKAGVELYGFKDKQEYIERFLECCSPEYQPDGERSDEKAVILVHKAFDEGHCVFEWMHQMPDGTPIPAEVELVRMKYGGEDVVIGYTRDLREHKAYLAEIEASQEDLRRARDIAEAANLSKTTFLANMSHEIRTPMNSIIGFSELALDDDISDKTKEYLEGISDNGKWLLNIINDILDSAKIESNNMILEHIPFSLDDVMSQCRSAILPKLDEKGLDLFCYNELSGNVDLIGDPIRLRQVFMNLLSNAVKFTNAGTIKLLASIKSSDETRVLIKFEVKDSGIGMDTQQIERVFEPFKQADDSISRKFGGTGLGLSIAKNIIELMGSSLSVESSPGTGSSFSFEISFEITDSADTPSEKLILNDIKKPYFSGEVLICEDNEMNQKVICEHLERVGLSSKVACNGKEGIDLIVNRIESGEKPFDLIFMDIHMPVMDGLETASKLREMKIETPVIALTANIMSNELDIYKKSGIPDYLGKPFTSQELWKCLIKYLPITATVDVDRAQQSAEDEKSLKQLQNYFVNNNQKTFENIRQAIESDDVKTAHRLTHSLKSNAGQINESQLREAAATVEEMLTKGKEFVAKSHLSNLDSALNTVLEKLALLTGDDNNSQPQTTDKSKIKEILEKLEPLLENRKPDCMYLLDSIRTIPGSETLAQHVEDFRFDQALEELKKLKPNLH